MRLTDHDAAFLYGETASAPMNASSICIIEGELEHDAVMAHVASRLHLVPRYRQRLVLVPFNLAHPKWVDDPDFDLANHVAVHTLPHGSSVTDGINACLKLNEALLDRERPLWKMWVVSGVPGKTLLLHIGHHAMIDGASGVDISLVLFDLSPEPPDLPPPDAPWQPAPLPDPASLITEAAVDVAGAFAGHDWTGLFSQERLEMLQRAGESMTRFVAKPVMTAPWNRAPVGLERSFRWQTYDFAEVRSIKSVLGGTVNDVVLAIVAEGAARYLAAHNERTDGQHLRAMCPVNVRREDESGALGNRVSAIFPMFDATPMDVAERLRKVRFETEQIKQNREAQAMELMMESVPSLPPVGMAQTLLVGTNFDPTALAAAMPLPVPPQFTPRPPMVGFNFTCTNVPGVQTTQYLLGKPISDMLGLLMLGGTLGFGVAVLTYNQKLTLNFIADPRLLPDIERMSSAVESAYQELKAAADAERAAS